MEMPCRAVGPPDLRCSSWQARSWDWNQSCQPLSGRFPALPLSWLQELRCRLSSRVHSPPETPKGRWSLPQAVSFTPEEDREWSPDCVGAELRPRVACGVVPLLEAKMRRCLSPLGHCSLPSDHS